jgi:hypothetical protein
MATGEENLVDKEMVRNPITDYLNQTNSSKSLARTYQSRFFAISAAHDLLLRSTTNKPCHFQLMLGQQLQMVPLPRRIERLLSISKVSTCGGYNETSICRSAVKQMREKIELDPMGIHIILVDNLGYTDKPSASHDSDKKTYRQYIKIIDLFVCSLNSALYMCFSVSPVAESHESCSSDRRFKTLLPNWDFINR